MLPSNMEKILHHTETSAIKPSMSKGKKKKSNSCIESFFSTFYFIMNISNGQKIFHCLAALQLRESLTSILYL